MNTQQAITRLTRIRSQYQLFYGTQDEDYKAISLAIQTMENLPTTIENAFDDGYRSGMEETGINGRQYYKSLKLQS